MRTVLYGAKCGAALAVVPGVAVALIVYLLAFGYEQPLIMGPLMSALVTGAVVVIGAALGAIVGGLVELMRARVRP